MQKWTFIRLLIIAKKSMIEALEKIILDITQATRVVDRELIQNLWSGYGELTRVSTDTNSVIAKIIKFPTEKDHPRGWSTNIGHERKVKSYQVEKIWYTNVQLIDGARMAKGLASGHIGEYDYILLEDLQTSGFVTKHQIDWQDIERCLSWLAHFHRYHMGHSADNLWVIGTYWHLKTRPEELEELTDMELKAAAPLIDKKLNDATHQTIVHGDAKLANFLFNDEQAAAVDFQYVGGGVGIKDVAYFLSSIFAEDQLADYEDECMDTYFRYLNLPEVEEEWRALYPLAWCDFYRFLQGWSPGHWKIHSYSEQMKEQALKCL